MSFNLTLVLSRRPVAAPAMATRKHMMFNYPHSFTGTNSAFTDLPGKEMYPDLDRNAQEGDLPQYAHQKVREFPEWYKPYTLNYLGHGWLAFFLSGGALLGYSYMNDIKELKGRKQRKKYPILREETHSYIQHAQGPSWVQERLAKGDPNWTKFLEKKERAAAHH